MQEECDSGCSNNLRGRLLLKQVGEREHSGYSYKYCVCRNNKAILSSAVLTLTNAVTYCLI